MDEIFNNSTSLSDNVYWIYRNVWVSASKEKIYNIVVVLLTELLVFCSKSYIVPLAMFFALEIFIKPSNDFSMISKNTIEI